MKKKMLALALAMSLSLSFALTGCGGSDSGSSDNNATGQSGTADGKQLAVQIGPDPETIDPALNSTVDGANMILTAFEGLLSTDEDGKIIPGQAESYDTSEDGLTWTFHLPS